MDKKIDISENNEEFFKRYIPFLTIACSLISAILFIGINTEENQDWDAFKKWGAPSPGDIFNGSYWGLVTSNFLHKEIWHIGFNLYWLWIFGKKIEFESSKIFYVWIILSSALVSSLAQFSFSESTGIGISGIVYSFFGFIYLKSKTVDSYKTFLDKKTTNLFLIWLVICIFLTQSKMLSIGNAAHIGGILWGLTLAYISDQKLYKQWIVNVIVLTFLSSMIFWSPFSTSYLCHKAHELHLNQKYDEAIVVYKEILEKEDQNEFAKRNLKQLEVYKLGEEALKYHNEKKFKEAKQKYNQILLIDKDNEWARENLKLIPNE